MIKILRNAYFIALLCFPLPALASNGPTHVRKTVYGVIESIRSGGKVLVIRHEAIPGLMQAMTMPFELDHSSLAAGLHPGDSVRFVIEKKGDFWPILSIKKIRPRHETETRGKHEP